MQSRAVTTRHAGTRKIKREYEIVTATGFGPTTT